MTRWFKFSRRGYKRNNLHTYTFKPIHPDRNNRLTRTGRPGGITRFFFFFTRYRELLIGL